MPSGGSGYVINSILEGCWVLFGVGKVREPHPVRPIEILATLQLGPLCCDFLGRLGASDAQSFSRDGSCRFERPFERKIQGSCALYRRVWQNGSECLDRFLTRLDQALGIEAIGSRKAHDAPDRGPPVGPFSVGRTASFQTEPSGVMVHNRREAFDHAARCGIKEGGEAFFRNDIGSGRSAKIEGVFGDNLCAD